MWRARSLDRADPRRRAPGQWTSPSTSGAAGRRRRRAVARLERPREPVRDARARTRRRGIPGRRLRRAGARRSRRAAARTSSTGSTRSPLTAGAPRAASTRWSGTRSAAWRRSWRGRAGHRRRPRRHGRGSRRRRPAAHPVPGHAGLRRPDGGRAAHAIRAPLLPRTVDDPFAWLSPVRRPLPGPRACSSCTTRATAWCRSREAARIVGANPGRSASTTRGLGHSRILPADPFLDAVLDFLATPIRRATDASPVRRSAGRRARQVDALALAG